MEKLLSLSAETEILLPDFRWWTLKDVDYRGNVFPDPANPSVNAPLSLKVNCNSVRSQLTLSPEPPTQESERLSSFGTTGSSPLHKLHRVHGCPHLVSHAYELHWHQNNCVACKTLFKEFDYDNKGVIKNIFNWMDYIHDNIGKHYRYCSVNLFREKYT